MIGNQIFYEVFQQERGSFCISESLGFANIYSNAWILLIEIEEPNIFSEQQERFTETNENL